MPACRSRAPNIIASLQPLASSCIRKACTPLFGSSCTAAAVLGLRSIRLRLWLRRGHSRRVRAGVPEDVAVIAALHCVGHGKELSARPFCGLCTASASLSHAQSISIRCTHLTTQHGRQCCVPDAPACPFVSLPAGSVNGCLWLLFRMLPAPSALSVACSRLNMLRTTCSGAASVGNGPYRAFKRSAGRPHLRSRLAFAGVGHAGPDGRERAA